MKLSSLSRDQPGSLENREYEAYYVKGPLTRSKRTLPLLMKINRGIVDLAGLITVAAKAVSSSPRIFPSLPKGLQYRQ